MTLNLPRGNEVDPGQRCPGTTKSSSEREVTLVPGQSLPPGTVRGSCERTLIYIRTVNIICVDNILSNIQNVCIKSL